MNPSAGNASVPCVSSDHDEALIHLLGVEENERGRLARDLHNQVGQNVAVCQMLLNELSRGGESARAAVVGKLQNVMAELAAELHWIAVAVRPVGLDGVGLEAALQSYLSEWSAVSKIPVSSHLPMADQPLSPIVESTVYRIVQEALRNVRLHARARGVAVIVERKRDVLAVIVEDDGRGFDAAAVQANPAPNKFGLPGMRARAALIDADLKIESTRGHGTTVYLRVPLATPLSPG